MILQMLTSVKKQENSVKMFDKCFVIQRKVVY